MYVIIRIKLHELFYLNNYNIKYYRSQIIAHPQTFDFIINSCYNYNKGGNNHETFRLYEYS